MNHLKRETPQWMNCQLLFNSRYVERISLFFSVFITEEKYTT